MEKFVIIKDVSRKIRRFNFTGRILEFKIKPLPLNAEPISWIKDGIEQIVKRGLVGLEPQDLVGFTFCSKDFQRGDGWMNFKPVSEVTANDVWDVISSIYQSNSTGLNVETFCLGVTSVKMPVGKGPGRKYNNYNEECAMRRGIISIKANDNLCLPRALVVAKSFVEKDSLYSKVRKDTGKIQKQRAIELIEAAQCPIPENGGGIPELAKFQNYLKEYKIVVYVYGTKGRDVIYEGVCESNKKLNLLYHDSHYNVITSLTAAFCCSYFCEECKIPYDHKDKHRCGGTCPACFQSPSCPVNQLKISCNVCNRYFRGQKCLENHLKQSSNSGITVCDDVYRCKQCYKIVKRKREHFCGEIFCKICNQHVPQGHHCYIQPDKSVPKTKDLLFIFYDLETRQERQLEDGSFLHEPNLCVFKQCCDACLSTNNTMCEKCGVRLQVLQNNVIERFVEYILNQRKIFKHVIVIGHNAGGFDHQFLLNHILTNTTLTPELIMRGTKLILMTVGNVKFLDSLNYFPMALSKLPDAFGLTELKKGYFPHLFNKLENQTYIGPVPSLEFYDPDNMRDKEREKFLHWHKNMISSNYVFDLQREIIQYCISDVEILSQACLRFRQQLLEIGNVCPFSDASTIASTCNKVYRRNFLKPNTIGVIPKNGYRYRDNQSKIAIQWLVWEEHLKDINIIHSAKQDEVFVAGIKVDGFCPETNEVFQFNGCYFHGCTQCFKYNRRSPLVDSPTESMETRYEATIAEYEHLKSKGFKIIQIWECEFRKQLNDEIRTFTESHPLVTLTPLSPRESFFGGRTSNFREYYKATGNEKIKYVDVCSLYPYVCKYGKFPIGHPNTIVGKDCKNLSLPSITGLIKCKILPPQNLFHPVLPQKMNNKLMFVLCRSCGETLNNKQCDHSEEDRMLTGTWIIDEVVKAIDMGYKLIDTYEIWQYDNVQKFDKIIGTDGLFTAMMNTFIKIKQEASGWPNNCRTDEEKNYYTEKFLEREDVRLEFSCITENPGLRSLAKLILNSFWGKFGQRENQSRTKIIKDPGELFDMLSNSAVTVNNLLPVNENTLIVTYQMREESYTTLSTVNVVIASYVTAQARLHLYNYLEKLGDRVLYCDTDSVIYISRPGEADIPTGEFIGEMTDELESYGPDSYITDFVSGGCKNYSFKIWSTKDQEYKVVCKVKGISLNYSASKLINFDSIKNMILEKSEPINIKSRNIRRTKTHEVVTREENKIYRTNSTKRKFSEDHSSFPYGYKKIKLS